MKVCILLVAALCLVRADEVEKAVEKGCKLPTVEDTDCSRLIVDCEDQLEEAHVNRGHKISCLDINSMDKENFFETTESCNVLQKCTCTVAYYLHCKYDPDDFNFAPPPNESPCFSGDTMVDTDKGTMDMRTLLNAHDVKVKVIGDSNQILYSPVLMWLHAEEKEYRFHDVVAGEQRLSLTDEHIVYTVPCEGGERTGKYAREVRVGDCVLVEQEGKMVATPVTELDRSTKTGLYTPITVTGTIVVNGVGASNYGSTKHEKMAHWVYVMFSHGGKNLKASGLHGATPGAFDLASLF